MSFSRARGLKCAKGDGRCPAAAAFAAAAVNASNWAFLAAFAQFCDEFGGIMGENAN